jgi:thiol-disulfide isomerase/thioredoxin
MRALLLVVSLLALGDSACRSAQADCSTPGEGNAVKDCRPPLAGLNLVDGLAVGDETLRGKVVLVNFWASWCPPCLKEIPALDAVYRKHQPQGFTVVGVLTGDKADDVTARGFLDERGASYPVVRGTRDLETRFSLGTALPMSFLYDRNGRLVRTWRGELTEDALEAEVKRLL